MSNVIQFLETMGRNPAYAAADYAAAVAGLQLDNDQQQALLDRDQKTLGKLLGQAEQARCALFVPDTIDYKCALFVPETVEYKCALFVPETEDYRCALWVPDELN